MSISIAEAVADNEANLFRSNSTCTRFLSAFARLHGYNYLRSLVQPLINTMLAMPPGTSYEIDPAKAIGQDVAANQKNVEYVASTFLNLMSSSLPALPGYASMIRLFNPNPFTECFEISALILRK